LRKLIFILLAISNVYAQYDPTVLSYEITFRSIELPESQVSFDTTLVDGGIISISWNYIGTPGINDIWLPTDPIKDKSITIINDPTLWASGEATTTQAITLGAGLWQFRIRAIGDNSYNPVVSEYSDRLDIKLTVLKVQTARVYLRIN